jgi:hypothetical protein
MVEWTMDKRTSGILGKTRCQANDTAQVLAVTQVKEHEKDEFWHKLLQKFSSFNKTIKVVARLKRFMNNSKKKPKERQAGPITVD